MRKEVTISSLLVVVALFISCNSTRSIASIDRQNLFKDKQGNLEPTIFTAHTDATQRISIIMADKTGRFITFSENPPDAAVESAMSIFAKATIDGKEAGKVDAQAKIEFAKTIAQLGKRSEAINFQRDGMFRLSELYNNGGIEKTELPVLINNLQTRTVEIAKHNAVKEVEEIKLKQLQELNNILAKADSTSKKPKTDELVKLIKGLQ